ncbi:MAG: hypothetical protein Q4P23_06800 [Micrococcaceae bacterium]|nr:hypothetical protein [Micrococcaceae bacterium]
MKVAIPVSPPLALQEYYRILTMGSDAYGAKQELRRRVTDHPHLTGSLAVHHMDSTVGFLRGMLGLFSTVHSITVIGEVQDDPASGVLCDAEIPGGYVRSAIRDCMSDTLICHDDGQDSIAKGGQ